MSREVSDLDRRLANIITIGRVKAVDPANNAVQVDLDGPDTDWITVMVPRAGADRAWWFPSINEQVAIASPSGDFGNAVIIGSLPQDAYPAAANTADVVRTVYQDNTVVEYDKQAHQLKVDASASNGTVLIVCQDATVKAASSITLDAPDTHCTGNLTVDKQLTYKGGMQGSNEGGSKAATISGGAHFDGGDLTHDDKNIGSTHTHSGVQPGNSDTGGPN